MKYSLGFIGAGMMGGALAERAVKSGNKAVIISRSVPERSKEFADRLGCDWGNDIFIAEESKYIVIGTLPKTVPTVLESIAPVIKDDRHIIVSMASGVTLKNIEEHTFSGVPAIVIMPNIPVAVGKGLVFYAKNEFVTDEELSEFMALFEPAGRLEPLDEDKFGSASVVAGCGPAFAAMFIDALADGGVKCGLSREKAILYAAEMVMGTAAMITDTSTHPDALKDRVCSPGGSTIEGVQALEEGAFRASVMKAVVAAYDKHHK